MEERRLESVIEMPKLLSFLTSRRWDERLTGLEDIPDDRWPDSVPLVYYAYHIMVGLGTILLAIAAAAALLLWRGRLFRSRATLWTLMLAWPFMYIANIAGWTTAETGRQPRRSTGCCAPRTAPRRPSRCRPARPCSRCSAFAGLYTLLAPPVRRGADGADRGSRARGPGPDHDVRRRRREPLARHGGHVVQLPRVHDHHVRGPRRLRPRRRGAPPPAGADRGGPRAGHGGDRTRLERQRGLADRRWWGAVHDLPEGVRRGVQRPLLRPHPPRSGCSSAVVFGSGAAAPGRQPALAPGVRRRVRAVVGGTGVRVRGRARQRRARRSARPGWLLPPRAVRHPRLVCRAGRRLRRRGAVHARSRLPRLPDGR